MNLYVQDIYMINKFTVLWKSVLFYFFPRSVKMYKGPGKLGLMGEKCYNGRRMVIGEEVESSQNGEM